jgi:hypothetical protein
MEEMVYIVIYRYSSIDHWHPKSDALFTDRSIAEGYVRGLQNINPTFEYHILEGAIPSPDTTSPEAESRLGPF